MVPASDPAPPGQLLADARLLIDRLRRPEPWPHPVHEPIGLVETHISWVLLTGSFAYKLPKPVDLGFLDFTGLEQRLHDCREELRLNRRLSSDLYLELMVVLGPVHRPRVRPAPAWAVAGSEPAAAFSTGSDRQPLAWAVRMRQFRQEDLLPTALARGAVNAEQIDALALSLARFHANAAEAPAQGSFGTPAAAGAPVRANFAVLAPRLPAAQAARLEQLRRWSENEWSVLAPQMRQRLAAGRVRECHGDLHLGNMLLEGGRIVVFDCLAFSPTLRWIDVISDMAFLVMDLEERHQPHLANRLLNRWLEHSGDYDGLTLWRWYVSYRALVRAKVAALADDRADPGTVEAYLAVAERQMAAAPPRLLICHGLSGSGKSRLAIRLAGELGAIRIRSDVERKRWFGLWGCPAQASREGDPYAADVSEELYGHHLPALASRLLAAGFSVIVDATFLLRDQRRSMAAVASGRGVPLHLLDLRTPLPLLRERIRLRARAGADPSDADAAVLARQLQQWQPLDDAERIRAIPIAPDTSTEAILSAILASGS